MFFFQCSDLMIKYIKSKGERFRGNRKFYYKIIKGYANHLYYSMY